MKRSLSLLALLAGLVLTSACASRSTVVVYDEVDYCDRPYLYHRPYCGPYAYAPGYRYGGHPYYYRRPGPVVIAPVPVPPPPLLVPPLPPRPPLAPPPPRFR